MDINSLQLLYAHEGASERVDLSILICRRFWWQLSLLTLIGILPPVFLISLITSLNLSDGLNVYWSAVLYFTIAPFCVARSRLF